MRDDFEFQPDLPAERPGNVATYATWRPSDLWIGVGAFVILFLVISAIFLLPFAEDVDDRSPGFLAASGLATLSWQASVVFVVYLLARRRGSGWAQLGFRNFTSSPSSTHRWVQTAFGFAPPWGLWATVTTWLTIFAVVYVYFAVLVFLGLEGILGSQLEEEVFENAWLVVIFGATVVVGAPLAEETFFRGFLFGGLRRRRSFLVAGLITGILFGLLHGLQVPGLVPAFAAVGVILARSYELHGTLLAPMGAHFFFNLFSFSLGVLLQDARG